MSIDVLEMWHSHQQKKRAEEGPKATAAGTPFRCSDAGSCIRKRGFAAVGAVESNEIAPTSLLAFEIGNSIHDTLQEAFAGTEGFQFAAEVPIDLSPLGVSLSGHCDGIITMPNSRKIIVEIKTMAGFGFKLAASGTSGGPKREHVAQAGLYALGMDASAILLVYVSKEGDFRAGFKPGAVLQWEYDLDDEVFPGETVKDVAIAELDNFKLAESHLETGEIAPRLVPNDAGELVEVDDVPAYMAKGAKPWQCAYCQYNDACAVLPSGPVPIDMIERITE
ncbi:MAG: hypothetical protein ACO3ME_10755 [Ilumatobacteraceae bacterium]